MPRDIESTGSTPVRLKEVVERVPVIGRRVVRLGREVRRRTGRSFPGSQQYWDKRYEAGGTSGAGSYNRLADFKASVINDFVRDQHVESVLEFGCGDGAQLSLASYPSYIGADVSPRAIRLCRSLFVADASKSFYLSSELPPEAVAEVTMSLDVIYHLVEDEVFDRYMADLFDRSTRFVIIYSSDVDRRLPEDHVRHRRFSAWIAARRPNWQLRQRVPNRYPYDPTDPDNTSFADFYIYELA